MKNMSLVVLIIFLFVSPILFADQPVDVVKEYPKALGFQGGSISGTGLSYFRQLSDFSWQVTGGVLYLPLSQDSYGDILSYVVGFETHFPVYDETITNWLGGQLYLFLGLNHKGVIPTSITGTGDAAVKVMGAYTPSVGIGGGIGIELILFQHFSIPLELGYGLTYSPTLGAGIADQLAVNLMPQAGFRYRYR